MHRVVAQGDPSSSLIEACKQADAEMLVLGSRGRGSFGGAAAGFRGPGTIRSAPCKVLICKANGNRPDA